MTNDRRAARKHLMEIEPKQFWREVFTIHGSVTLQVLPRVLTFGLIAATIWIANELTHEFDFHLAVAPYEVAGAVLGLLLVLRTNAGYDRWWEARKLWGGIVNQSRNLAISALSYGPSDPAWQARFVNWVAAFPHVARRSLRGERDLPEVSALLGEEDTAKIAAAGHMPSFVAWNLAEQLAQGIKNGGMNPMAFLQVDKERATLIDHIGGCERILKTPLPRVYGLTIRRFIGLFLVALPFALLDKVGALTPLVTMFVAYPILALDQTGVELQQPFSTRNLGHLPLDDISQTIEANLKGLMKLYPLTRD
jgi:putative membrane protein